MGSASQYSDVPDEVVARLRVVCTALPQAYEEPAWVGTRWRIRTKTFAHVLGVEPGAPPAFIKAAALEEPAVILTFRSSGPELEMLRNAGHPYFYAGWGRDAVGMVLDEDTDWEEVGELLTESYCMLAPKKLVALVDRPEA